MFFRRKMNAPLTDPQLRYNKLMDLYGSGKLEEKDFSAFCLTDYLSGVCSEGHWGWFASTSELRGASALAVIVGTLGEILPRHLNDNLKRAYASFGTPGAAEVCEAADRYFLGYEEEVYDALQQYADGLFR